MSRVRAGARVPALPRQAEGIRVRVEEGLDRVHRSGQEADARPAEPGPAVRHDRLQLQGPHRARHDRHRAGHHQRHHQGRVGPAAEGLLHAGARREGHGLVRARRLQRDRRGARRARTTRSTSSSSRSRASVPGRCDRGRRRRPADRFLPARNRRAEEVPRQGGQAAARARSAGQGRTARRSPTSSRSRTTGASTSATTSSSTSAAWGG